MHKVGWVHHDISMGNIVIVKDRAMILDMEYAKEMDQEGDRCIVSFTPLTQQTQLLNFDTGHAWVYRC